MNIQPNRVRATLPPLYKRLLKADAAYTGATEARIVSDILVRHYELMPKEKVKDLLKALD